MATEVTLDLNIQSAGAAFQDGNAPTEVARVLRALANMIDAGREGHFHLLDANGNGCGRAMLEIWGDADE
jgi:hypothetical protein